MGTRNINFLYGEEKYLLNEFMENAEDIVAMPEINVHIFEGDLDEQKVVAAVEQLPFCSKINLTIVKNDFKKVTDYFINKLKDIPDTTRLFLICEDKIDKRTKFYKAIKRIATIREFKKLNESSLYTFISKEIEKRNAKISGGAINLLIMRTGYLQKEKTNTNLYSIMNYVDKLTNYSSQINEETIERLVDLSPEENAFKLMDMLTASKVHEAFKYATGLIENGSHPLGLMALITRHFRILLKLCLVDDPQVLGLHPFTLRNMKKHIGVYSENELTKIIDLCLEFQRKIKTGKLPPVLALENLLVSIGNIRKTVA